MADGELLYRSRAEREWRPPRRYSWRYPGGRPWKPASTACRGLRRSELHGWNLAARRIRPRPGRSLKACRAIIWDVPLKKKTTRAATPAIAALETAGVAYTLHPYDVDPSQDDYGVAVAHALGVDAGRVYKTLVAKLDGSDLVCAVIPVERRLDLKALAREVGARQAALADRTEAERRTGYVRGGISPLGQRQQLAVVLDESALPHPTMFVSAGKRGLQVELSPADLLRLTQAQVAAVAD